MPNRRRIAVMVATLLLTFAAAAYQAPPAFAVSWELNIAQAGTPGGSDMDCTFFSQDVGEGCFQPDGDVFWVLNYSGQSTIWWWNYYPGDNTLYRQGKCESLTFGGWACRTAAWRRRATPGSPPAAAR